MRLVNAIADKTGLDNPLNVDCFFAKGGNAAWRSSPPFYNADVLLRLPCHGVAKTDSSQGGFLFYDVGA